MAEAAEHAGQKPAETEAPTPQQQGQEASGYRGNNPATAGPGQTAVRSETPENATGEINPSAPGDTGVTPGSVAE